MKLQMSRTNLRIVLLVVLLGILLATVGYKISHKENTLGTDVKSNGVTKTSNTANDEQSANGNQSTVNQQAKIITLTTKQQFISKHQDWVNRLDSIAQKTNSTYGDWNAGKIETEEFLNNALLLRKEIKTLNKETDLYTEFNLNSADQKSANYTAVKTGYAHASKDVNDFLECVFSLQDKDIKINYTNLMENKYKNDLVQLKSDLKM